MTVTGMAILLGTGIGVGFLGGLLGIGGAFIMTPVQYGVYLNMGVPADTAIKLAFGTSLLVAFCIALSGTWRHAKKAAVRWKVAIIMGSCSLIASFGGASIAAHLPGEVLKITFGIIILLGGIRMLTVRQPQIEEKPRDNPWLWVAWALPIGIVVGLVGIGGGILALPVMTLALRFKLHNAIATSLAMVILSSLGGVVGYITYGIGSADLPAYSLGYVNLPSWFLLTVGSVGMAQIGAITAHRLPARQLRYIFLALTFYMALKILGVFDWLGWQI